MSQSKEGSRERGGCVRSRISLNATGRDGVLSGIATATEALCRSRGLVRSGADVGTTVLRDLRRRECQGSTAVGGGLAIPHATIEGLQVPILTRVDLIHAVPWDAEHDGEEVSRCFVVMTPPNAPAAKLEILREVAETAAEEGQGESLLSTPAFLQHVNDTEG